MGRIRLLRASDVRRACPMAEAMEAVRAGFAARPAGTATVPLRVGVPLQEGGTVLTMPAALAGGAYWSVKVVTVAPGNPGRGYPLIHANVLLGDAVSGAALAMLEGSSLTALRTGAAGGVAAAVLARADSAVLALFGAGAQARTQLVAAATALRLREARVVSRDPAHPEALVPPLPDQ